MFFDVSYSAKSPVASIPSSETEPNTLYTSSNLVAAAKNSASGTSSPPSTRTSRASYASNAASYSAPAVSISVLFASSSPYSADTASIAPVTVVSNTFLSCPAEVVATVRITASDIVPPVNAALAALFAKLLKTATCASLSGASSELNSFIIIAVKSADLTTAFIAAVLTSPLGVSAAVAMPPIVLNIVRSNEVTGFSTGPIVPVLVISFSSCIRCPISRNVSDWYITVGTKAATPPLINAASGSPPATRAPAAPPVAVPSIRPAVAPAALVVAVFTCPPTSPAIFRATYALADASKISLGSPPFAHAVAPDSVGSAHTGAPTAVSVIVANSTSPGSVKT